MYSVFLLQHSYEVNEIEETKIIGIYSTKEKAEKIIDKYKELVGFKDHPNCFFIDEYKVDNNYWEEGFISENDAIRLDTEE